MAVTTSLNATSFWRDVSISPESSLSVLAPSSISASPSLLRPKRHPRLPTSAPKSHLICVFCTLSRFSSREIVSFQMATVNGVRLIDAFPFGELTQPIEIRIANKPTARPDSNVYINFRICSHELYSNAFTFIFTVRPPLGFISGVPDDAMQDNVGCRSQKERVSASIRSQCNKPFRRWPTF